LSEYSMDEDGCASNRGWNGWHDGSYQSKASES
jgi:hypothetical protein